MSRQQEIMGQAIDHISAHASDQEARRKIYGGLYHKLPVLIRTCGLCQALAFVNSKRNAGSDRGAAHTAIMGDVQAVLTAHCGITLGQQDNGQILNAVRRLPTRQYALATRILLQSLVFHKRFAESILGAEATDYTPEDSAAADEEKKEG